MIINRHLPEPPPAETVEDRVRNAIHKVIEENHLEQEREFDASTAGKVLAALIISICVGTGIAVVMLIVRALQ